MATALSPEEISRLAEVVQRRFLEEYKDSGDIDVRDYKRVKTCLPYVSKFVRHKQGLGDVDAAYQMMVDCLLWRKTFGVQDLAWDRIDTSYFQSGIGIPHGDDRDGSALVILNCHLHRKDMKKFPQLQKFFVFCIESHARLHPDKKITMLFNMSQCGISNMDMEFVKFIINCFKYYFPDMLNYLLVFEMPWVLQAAWKIIKGWLGEAAIRKIKFVTKSDITEYISPDQLMVQFGGTDTWTYRYDPDELRKQAEQVWERDPLIAEDDEQEEEEDGFVDDYTPEESLKQVRFAPGQPPSRQSRFGSQDETDGPSPTPSSENQLRRGTASSPGYRRRQVNKLMSLQKSSDQPSMSLPPILEDSDRRVSTYHLQHQLSVNTTLRINPGDELLFKGPSSQELLCNVTLTNTTDDTVAYKIKTTAPNRYKVRPNINLVEGGETASIQVKLLSGSSELVSQDKFLVQAYRFNPGTRPPDTVQLPSFWRSLGRHKSVEEYRLRCRYVHEVAKPFEPDVDSQHKQGDNSAILILQNKVDQLTVAVGRLQNTVDRVWYICIALLLLIIVINVFL